MVLVAAEVAVVVVMMMMMMVKIMIIMMIIIMILIGANQDFSPISHCAMNCLRQTCASGQGAVVSKSPATHQTLITCNILCATLCKGTAQPLIGIAFTLASFHLLKTQTDAEAKESTVPRECPED